MEWQMILAILIVIPIILFPMALIGYLNLDGVITAIKEFKSRRAIREKEG